jgi:hypothetical protein
MNEKTCGFNNGRQKKIFLTVNVTLKLSLTVKDNLLYTLYRIVDGKIHLVVHN